MCVVLAVAALILAPLRARRLVWRVRLLALAIAILFAFFTPGEAVWPLLDGLGPTREGLVLALQHAARLVSVVVLVAILLERTPPEQLIAGLYPLCAPFALLGVSRERLALRLMLVLRYVTERPEHGWRGWMDDAAADGRPALELAPVRIARSSWGLVDFAAAACLCVVLAAWGVR